jgi:3',5'-cyclic AMP phosphodiesterase CpdA
MRLRLSVLILSLAFAGIANAGMLRCEGRVFLDRDGDGRQDRGEPGVADVGLSDGARILRTDTRGRFDFRVEDGRSVFLIKPAGYSAAMRSDGVPDTWRNLQRQPGPRLAFGGVPTQRRSACGDFALREAPKRGERPLQVHLSGDPQFKSMTDVGYYRRDIIEPALALGPVDLAVTMGDLVDDHLELYPALKAEDGKLKAPWLHAPGNHDLDFDAGADAHSLDSFRHAFGPDTYAWEEPEAAFIVLDDVLFQGPAKSNYLGGLRPDQFAFLAAYLAHAPKDRLLVLAMHIPLFPVPGQESFNPADRARLFALLKPFPKLLILSAHTHKQMTVFHDASTGWQGATPLREYNIGAACGAYWTGLKDAAGIPDSTMNDGTPNGYARMQVGADGVPHLRYFSARAPLDQQMTVHAPKVLRHNSYPAFGVFANVWMGHAGTKVEFRVDGGEWKPMKLVALPDPALTTENARDDEAQSLRGYDRSPEAVISTHLWRGTLPTNLGLGEHRVEVSAQLDEGPAMATTSYQLDEAAP